MQLERPSILLVDDEHATLEILGSVLSTQGFEVSLAVTPEEATRLLRAGRYDAVVTDVVFEGRAAGPEVLAASKAAQPEPVVLLMTGYPEVDGAVAALKSGAVDYLQKPVDPLQLARELRRVIEQRELTIEALAYQDLVDILSNMVARTIERVDPYTAGHGERTRRYCKAIAEHLGVDRYTTERLELAAIAHDYGKIYLEDLAFLTKAGPLTDSEYRKVQNHPRLGAKMLGDHPHLKDVCVYVEEHHERWDGRGYPARKKGEEITVAGRILALVEVFDSLSTRRSYKKAWSLEKTCDFFEDQSGVAFDPDVSGAFLTLLDKHGTEWTEAPRRDQEAAGLVF